ncbi:MAG: LTA synthase family protein [Thermoanaerobaculales bacterium]|nr:LTA synthase family protein [Thermoanaerobaculales bacterium]
MFRLVLVLQLLLSFPVWAGQQWDLDVLDAGLPEVLETGDRVIVEVELMNRGSRAWDPEIGFAVAAHWFLPGNKVLEWEGLRTPLPTVVEPGESVLVEAVLEVPKMLGPALVRWDVVQDPVLWVSERSGRQAQPVVVEIVKGRVFELLKADIPSWPVAGRQLTATLVIRNSGAMTWGVGESLGVAAHWRRTGSEEAIWEGPRTHFARPVKPGETVTVEAVADVPIRSGRWLIEWDMVEEGVCWFSQQNGRLGRDALVVVLPGWSEAWSVLLMTLGLLLFATGARRQWWPGLTVAGWADLLWLVGAPLLVAQDLVRAGLRGVLLSIALLTALAALLALLPRKWRPWAAWATGAAWIVLLVGDRIYLRFFGDLPSLGSIKAVTQVDRLGQSIAGLFNPGDLALLCAAGSGVLVAAAVARIPLSPKPLRLRLGVAASVICMTVLLLGWQTRVPAVKQIFRRIHVAQEFGVVGAHHLDIATWFRRSVLSISVGSTRIAEVERWFRDTAPIRAGTGPHFGAAGGYNLVMVQAESLQAFVVGLEIGGSEVTPNLNRWVRESLWFNRVTDQTSHGRSSDAELLTQVSLLPLPDGAAAFEHAGNRFTSLAGLLSGYGYYTLSAVPFERSFWNRQNTHRAYGYGNRLFSEDFAPGELVGWGLNDRSFLQQMGDRIAVLPNPFCVWMITLSLHHPFEGFPDHLQELNVGSWTESPVGEYLHTMHLLDAALGDLESAIQVAGLAETTIVAVWGDHDAGFEWTPEVAALMGVDVDAAGWYDSQRIPFVLRAPQSLGLRGVIDVPAGHIDVAPTLAALLGIDPAPLAWMGRNLLGSPGDEPVIGEYSCWTDRTHVFLQGDGTLRGGQCLARTTLEPETTTACESAFEEASRRLRISQTVLRHDLQEDLTAAGRFLAYASVLDNRSDDPVFIPAQVLGE